MRSPFRPRLAWALALIVGGGVWGLNTLGYLPAGWWAALAQLWPVALVAVGLDMFIGRRSVVGSVVVIIATTLLVSASLAWMAVRASGLSAGEARPVIQSLRDATGAAVKLDFPTGDLQLTALNGSVYLMEGEVADGPADTFQQNYIVQEAIGRLMLAQEPNVLLAPFVAGRAEQARWDIRLTQEIPMALEIKTRAGRATLALTNLRLTRFDLQTETGQVTVLLPVSAPLVAEVEASAGDVTLAIPSTMPTRLTLRSSESRVRLPSRFTLEGEVYLSPGFDPTLPFLDLTVNTGVGIVTVK